MSKEQRPMVRDALHTRVNIRFGMMDRLKVMLGWRVSATVRAEVDYPAGSSLQVVSSSSELTVWHPALVEQAAAAMVEHGLYRPREGVSVPLHAAATLEVRDDGSSRVVVESSDPVSGD